jgi:hypothetical protein
MMMIWFLRLDGGENNFVFKADDDNIVLDFVRMTVRLHRRIFIVRLVLSYRHLKCPICRTKLFTEIVFADPTLTA